MPPLCQASCYFETSYLSRRQRKHARYSSDRRHIAPRVSRSAAFRNVCGSMAMRRILAQFIIRRYLLKRMPLTLLNNERCICMQQGKLCRIIHSEGIPVKRDLLRKMIDTICCFMENGRSFDALEHAEFTYKHGQCANNRD